MAYMLLIIERADQRIGRTNEEAHDAYDQMVRFAEGLKKRGILRAVESLAAQDKGARVQVREGRTQVLDGPFTESKEMVGGFFLLDCGTLEEAVSIARECPAASWSTVEVRKVAPCWE